ncbi:MAG: hypothetical protein GW839_13440 [Flavobacteriales bacterium]|nr:hypothetical protein [Flavobacteriia bacterium]NCP06635.1 hypothetical protein [Flavobacteriales bacterium]PIV94833.1 MAG: hypothetical protein COW44_02105 [Flavobacteriaceae bacterium CG17_big_fil_post_rev_8_21_14_2_50_33_15]PIY11508.1 MAG: hypothetical protein COZ17_06555 [Flavobacteriaceae bacterium CG_4_10_14_3_um_filter_33_47]PJB17057.1 MAG: hypothetical protein CO117_13025 [Flavobacteriaceae bacterium CG_4_9_14_3_um_filter_33_16]
MENTATSVEMLFEKAKKYSETSLDLLALNAVDKTGDVLSSLASRVFIAMAVAMFTLFFNIGISLVIGKLLHEYYLGFLIVSAFYLITATVLWLFKAKLIETPIDNMIVAKLLKSRRTGINLLDKFKEKNNGTI